MRSDQQALSRLLLNSLMILPIYQHATAQKSLSSLQLSAKSGSLVRLIDTLCNRMRISIKLTTQGQNQALFLLQL